MLQLYFYKESRKNQYESFQIALQRDQEKKAKLYMRVSESLWASSPNFSPSVPRNWPPKTGAQDDILGAVEAGPDPGRCLLSGRLGGVSGVKTPTGDISSQIRRAPDLFSPDLVRHFENAQEIRVPQV